VCRIELLTYKSALNEGCHNRTKGLSVDEKEERDRTLETEMRKHPAQKSPTFFALEALTFCFFLSGVIAWSILIERQEKSQRVNPDLITIKNMKLAPPIGKYPLRIFAEVSNESDEVVDSVSGTFKIYSASGELMKEYHAPAVGFASLEPNQTSIAIFPSYHATKRSRREFGQGQEQTVRMNAEVTRVYKEQ